jgi:DNA-binding SARP family transcriptional activator
MGRLGEAEALARQSLALAPRTYSSIWSWLILGLCVTTAGQLEAGEDHYQRAEDLSRELGYDYGRALVLINLGHMLYWMRGQYDLALAASDESRRLYSALGLSIMSHATFHAVIAVRRGDRARARQALLEAEAITPPGSWQAGQLAQLAAQLAILEEDFDQAAELLTKARAISEATGDAQVGTNALIATAAYWRALGQPAQAVGWSTAAVDWARRRPFRLGEGMALAEHGRAAWGLGDMAGAKANWDQAQAIARELGDAVGLAEATLLLAAAQQALGQPEADATWLKASRLIQLRDLGFVLENERDLAFPLLAAHSRSTNPQARSAAEQLLSRLAQVPPRPLRVVGLGRFEVWQGRRLLGERDWQRRRTGELFRLLLLAPGHALPREAVLEALWPNQPAMAARNQLHQATSTLRHLLEPDLPERFPSRYLDFGGERLALNLPLGSSVDFEQWEQALREALAIPTAPDANARLEALQQAVTSESGELFPADRYADWAAPAREGLAALRLNALVALAGLCLAAGRPEQGLEACRHVLAVDPWREEAVLTGMQACLSLNDRPGALRLYQALEATLRADLDLAPRADLQQLAATLRE